MAPDSSSVDRPPRFCIWLGLALPRVEAFCWLAVVGKASTVGILRRRGVDSINILDMCSLCGKEIQSISHLFNQCGLSVHIWNYFLKMWYSLVILCSLGEMIATWKRNPI